MDLQRTSSAARSVAGALLLAAAAGCASSAENSDDARPLFATTSDSGAIPADADVGAAGVTEASARVGSQQSRMHAGELSIWTDPRFQRRFVESYLSETEVEPRITLDERDAMEKILEYISSDQVDRAIKRLREEQARGGSAVFDFTLANIYFQNEQLEPAAAAYQTAVEKFPNFRRAYKNLGLIQVREGEFADAARSFTRVIELGGGDAVTYGLLGYSYTNTEDYLSAESAYRMASLLDPATWDWKMGLARAFFKQRRYGEAIALCDTMIRQDPDRAELWMLQANAYIGLGKPMEAAKNFEVVDQLGGSTPASLNNLADIYANGELFDLAVTAYLRALEADGNGNLDRPMRAARVLTAHGALEETETLVAGVKAIRGDALTTEENLEVLRLEARLAVAQGGGAKEAEILEEIVALDPLDGEALLLLGQYWQRTGELEKAVFYYERAENVEGFEADAKVRRAQLLVTQGNYNDALPLLRSAQNLQPRDHVQAYLDQVERIAKNR